MHGPVNAIYDTETSAIVTATHARREEYRALAHQFPNKAEITYIP